MLAITHEIIKQGLYDRDFLVDYTNAAELVDLDPASNDYGMFIRTNKPVEEGCFDAQNKLWWDRKTNGPVDVRCEGCDPYLLGEYELEGRHGQDRVPDAQGAGRGVHVGMGVGYYRNTGRDDQAPGPRDGRHRAGSEDRVAHPVDRRVGQGTRLGHR
jgi:hypothetical protein